MSNSSSYHLGLRPVSREHVFRRCHHPFERLASQPRSHQMVSPDQLQPYLTIKIFDKILSQNCDYRDFSHRKAQKNSTIFDIVLCVYIIIYLAISAFLILSSLLLLKNHHRKNSYFEYWSQNGLNFLDLGLFLSETDADLLRTGLRWDWGIVFIFRLLQTWPQRTGAATC